MQEVYQPGGTVREGRQQADNVAAVELGWRAGQGCSLSMPQATHRFIHLLCPHTSTGLELTVMLNYQLLRLVMEIPL